jgi:hypothetical protein
MVRNAVFGITPDVDAPPPQKNPASRLPAFLFNPLGAGAVEAGFGFEDLGGVGGFDGRHEPRHLLG